MKNNIITVVSIDATSIDKGITEVMNLFDSSIQTAVFTKQNYSAEIKETVDKFRSIGCPFFAGDKSIDGDGKFEEIKNRYQNVVLVD